MGAFFAHPAVGGALSMVAGVAFLAVCMLLPLVGRAGVATPHAGRNHQTLLGMLVLALVLAGVATASKTMRRRRDGGPPAVFSLILLGLCLLLLGALAAGWIAL